MAVGYPTTTWSVEQLTALIQSIIGANDFDDATITNSTVNSSVIGGTTPAAGHFTTLDVTDAVALSPASHNVVLSPTGTGVVTIAPATAGSMDRVNVGATTRGTGAFTTLAANGAVTLTSTVSMSNASLTLSAIPTADPHVAGRVWANVGILTISAG